MSFMYPLCLLALLGIPAVIIIYILRSQYTEQTVNSTYIWTLSERFLKRRNPLSGLTGIIALILQLLMVLLITLALVKPIITLKDAANEYCFILDASASMNMSDGEKTRFEKGKDEIEDVISSSKRGSEYTLIYVNDEATTIYEGVSSKKTALKLLSELEPSYAGSNIDSAKMIAQEFFNKSPSTETYLVTDKSYNMHQNVTIIDVSGDENNYGITDVICQVNTEIDGTSVLTVGGKLNSYKKPTSLRVEAYVDGADAPSASGEFMILPTADGTEFELEKIKLDKPSYSSVRVVIANEDALFSDNEVIIYNAKNEKQYKTIIVSEAPFFLEASIDAVGDYDVISASPEEFEAKYKNSSFGLYIFDSYVPAELPEGGTVWMINANQSVSGAGFSYRSEVVLKEPCDMEKSTSSQSTIRALLKGVNAKDLYLIKYLRYSTSGDYMTLLSTDGIPLVMAGENDFGNRMVLFAFDIHDSNIALTGDFVSLVDNLINYSFPSVLDSTSYIAGEEIIINTVANCESVKVISPSGKTKYLDTQKTMNTYVLGESGTYTVEVNAGGSIRTHSFFSETPYGERAPKTVEQNFSIIGTPSRDRLDGEFDPTIIIFVLIALIFAADWMVYMYEKRQLR